MSANYEFSVFINCPFDEDYISMQEGLIFAIQDCGFIPRCALEIIDGSQSRIEKISEIIKECKYGIHDISRTDLDSVNNLPRFNMPLELGLFLGAKRFGTRSQKLKNCLIFDIEKYRYQKFISDIAGQDVLSHQNSVVTIIKAVRNWLGGVLNDGTIIPSGSIINARFIQFKNDLPMLCETFNLDENELNFNDKCVVINEWLKFNKLVV